MKSVLTLISFSLSISMNGQHLKELVTSVENYDGLTLMVIDSTNYNVALVELHRISKNSTPTYAFELSGWVYEVFPDSKEIIFFKEEDKN